MTRVRGARNVAITCDRYGVLKVVVQRYIYIYVYIATRYIYLEKKKGRGRRARVRSVAAMPLVSAGSSKSELVTVLMSSLHSGPRIDNASRLCAWPVFFHFSFFSFDFFLRLFKRFHSSHVSDFFPFSHTHKLKKRTLDWVRYGGGGRRRDRCSARGTARPATDRRRFASRSRTRHYGRFQVNDSDFGQFQRTKRVSCCGSSAHARSCSSETSLHPLSNTTSRVVSEIAKPSKGRRAKTRCLRKEGKE